MTDMNYKVVAIDDLLHLVEREVLSQYESTLRFIRTPHTARANKEYKTRIEELDFGIVAIHRELLDSGWSRIEIAEKTKELRQRCVEFGKYTEKMYSLLANDLAKRHRIEDKTSIDLIKNATFVLGPPGAFLGAFTAGLGEGLVNIYEVVVAGFAVSVGILFSKKIAVGLGSIIKAENREIATRIRLQNRKEPVLGLA